jgi:hypothetical protein
MSQVNNSDKDRGAQSVERRSGKDFAGAKKLIATAV